MERGLQFPESLNSREDLSSQYLSLLGPTRPDSDCRILTDLTDSFFFDHTSWVPTIYPVPPASGRGVCVCVCVCVCVYVCEL